jgi:hypothetical protein
VGRPEPPYPCGGHDDLLMLTHSKGHITHTHCAHTSRGFLSMSILAELWIYIIV